MIPFFWFTFQSFQAWISITMQMKRHCCCGPGSVLRAVIHPSYRLLLPHRLHCGCLHGVTLQWHSTSASGLNTQPRYDGLRHEESAQETNTGVLFRRGSRWRAVVTPSKNNNTSRWNTRGASDYWWLPRATGHLDSSHTHFTEGKLETTAARGATKPDHNNYALNNNDQQVNNKRKHFHFLESF